jgi:uncharacterized protein
MGGTLLNIVTVFAGSMIGLLVGNRLSARMQESVVTGLGLVTLVVGLDNTGKTGNIIIPLLATVIGVMIGEALRLDVGLEKLAGWLQVRFGGEKAKTDTEVQVDGMTARERFITGFVTASLVFCVGPLTFAGSIQDGMGVPSGFQFLAIKSVLDFFAAMAFAASFGIGVTFTILTILVLQGGLALVGSLLVMLMSSGSVDFANNAAINEMTAVGGILLIGLSLVLLDIKKPRVANFLPALLVAPLIVIVAGMLGINIYPL